jgi:NTE family protein
MTRVPDAPVPVVSEGLGLLVHSGAYRGDWIHQWLRSELADLGVRTFGDLRRDDPGDDAALSAAQRYRLVVMATDVTRGRLLRLPWDYDAFGLDPDEQPVADAVRMSLSIPFYFRPCTLPNLRTGRPSTVVDGGVLSNFPIGIFDRTDDQPARWPTFGVRLMPDLPEGLGDLVPLLGLPALPVVRLLEQVVTTALVGTDQTHLDAPGVRERAMTVDTKSTPITDFGIGKEDRQRLIAEGERTAQAFLAAWQREHA